MAIAGRVAIVPKGEYSNAVTYDKLDLIMFNNDAYIAKKASTGVEPTNDEYWMLILNNVVAEDLEKIIDGTTTVGNALQLGGKDASEYALGTDLANYLPLSGGTVNGNLTLDNGSSSAELHIVRDTTQDGGVTSAQWVDKNNAIHHLRLKRENSSNFATYNFGEDGLTFKPKDPNDPQKEFLHTGNKPTGTYTGNGSSDTRYFSIPSASKELVIYSANGVVFVFGTVSIWIGSDGKATLQNSYINYNGSTLGFYSSSSLLNASGVTYTYHGL